MDQSKRFKKVMHIHCKTRPIEITYLVGEHSVCVCVGGDY